jgi:hypothetical protein
MNKDLPALLKQTEESIALIPEEDHEKFLRVLCAIAACFQKDAQRFAVLILGANEWEQFWLAPINISEPATRELLQTVCDAVVTGPSLSPANFSDMH